MTNEELEQDIDAKLYALEHAIMRLGEVINERWGEDASGPLEDAMDAVTERLEYLAEAEDKDVIPGTKIKRSELSLVRK